MNLQEIQHEVRRMDPKVSGESFKAAVVLLAALVVGPSAPQVSAFTGYPIGLCREFSARLRESGVWKDGKTHCEWFDDKCGGTAFWLDVAVAQGFVERAKPRRKIKSQKIGSSQRTGR